jgi:bifunctional ADP-heptose synthase (sugar kinase/adenylyltransferase)
MKCSERRVAELTIAVKGASYKATNMAEIDEITYFGGQVQAFRVTR